jgi:hypothetical protein
MLVMLVMSKGVSRAANAYSAASPQASRSPALRGRASMRPGWVGRVTMVENRYRKCAGLLDHEPRPDRCRCR